MAHNTAATAATTEHIPRPIRARDLGLDFPGTPGPFNAITDVPGVRVGFTTLTDPLHNIRTGVTAILPRPDNHDDDDDEGLLVPQPVWAGHYALNGNGEMTGTHWIDDAGYFLGPICITNTHSVGQVHHGVTRYMIQHYADYFSKQHAWAMPVVAETYDGVLNDINAQHVTGEHAMEAIRTAQSGFVQEGSSGGGNGMICYEFKGGTGTSSRQVNIGSDGNGQQHPYTMGALVQANHGIRPWLNILGKPVGQILNENRLLEKEGETGSIIVILATDAPMSGLQLRQLAKRAAIGVGRGGSPGGNSSGDIFLAFSVANPRPIVSSKPIITESFETINNNYIDPLYLAAVECVEEAVVNAIVAGQDVPTFKPQGRVCSAIDTQRLASIFQDSS